MYVETKHKQLSFNSLLGYDSTATHFFIILNTLTCNTKILWHKFIRDVGKASFYTTEPTHHIFYELCLL